MTSPKINGRIVEIFPQGQYTVAQPVCVVEDALGK